MWLWLLIACKATTSHPDATPHGTWVDENLLLSDGVAKLLAFEDCEDLAPLPIPRARTGEVLEEVPFWGRTWALADGSTLVMVATTCSGVVTDRYALVRTDGSLVPVGRPAVPAYTTTPDPRGVAVAGGMLLVDCDAGVSMWADPSGSLATVDASAMCSRVDDTWTIGPSSQGRVAFVTVGGGSLEASAWSLSGGALVEDPAAVVVRGAGEGDRPLFVEETEVATYGWLVDSGTFDQVQYAGSGEGPAITVGTAHPSGQHPTLASGSVFGQLTVTLADGEGVVSLVQVDTAAGIVTPVATAAPAITLPLAHHAWFGMSALVTTAVNPSDDDELLDSPVEMDLRTFTGGLLSSSTPASTPCVDRWRCRSVGESYLVAVAGDVGFYGMWDWYGYGAVYVAPVSRTGP